MTLALLAGLLAMQGGPTDYPKRITVDVLRNADPWQLLLSDDGAMGFNFSGQCRRARLPGGPLLEGDLIVLLGGHQVTISQASHLTGERTLFSPVPLASPRAGRALLGAPVTTLVCYEARGKRPNPTLDVYVERIVRSLDGGAYLALGFRPGDPSRGLYRIDTADDRLEATRVGDAPPEHAPPPLPDAPGRRIPGRDWSALPPGNSSGDPTIAITVESDGRRMLHEWRPGMKEWRSFAPPIDQGHGTMDVEPRLLSFGSRLFAMPFRMGSPENAWTYEASPDRKSWRKVSDRILLTVSASGAFCLTRDLRTGVAWLERFAEFVGKG